METSVDDGIAEFAPTNLQPESEMYDYRTFIISALVGLGMVSGFAGSGARADDPMGPHRANYEASHPWVNLTTSRTWFAHPTERTPCGMNGWGAHYRTQQVYMPFLNTNQGPGPTRYTCQEATGSHWGLKRTMGPFPSAHASTKPFEFEKDIGEDK